MNDGDYGNRFKWQAASGEVDNWQVSFHFYTPFMSIYVYFLLATLLIMVIVNDMDWLNGRWVLVTATMNNEDYGNGWLTGKFFFIFSIYIYIYIELIFLKKNLTVTVDDFLQRLETQIVLPDPISRHASCQMGLSSKPAVKSCQVILLRLQTIKAIVDSCSFKSLKSDEPRRVQVLDLYCLTRFESESSSKGIVY